MNQKIIFISSFFCITILFLNDFVNSQSQFSDQFIINYLKKEETRYNSIWSNVNVNYLFNIFCLSDEYDSNYELLYTKTINHFIPSMGLLEKNNFFNRLNLEIQSMQNYSTFGTNSAPIPSIVADICRDHYEDIRIPTRNFLKIQDVINLEYNETNGVSIELQTQQNSRIIYYLLLSRIEQAYNINSNPSRLQYTGQIFMENAFFYLAAIYEGIYNGVDMGILDHTVFGIEYNDGFINTVGTLEERLNELTIDVLNKYATLQNNIITCQRSLCLLGLICIYPSVYDIPSWNQLTSLFWYSNPLYYYSSLYFISDLPIGHNNLSSALTVDLNQNEYSIYVIDWYLMGKSITCKPFSYVLDPYLKTNQVADFMTGLRGYAFTWKGAGILNPQSGSAIFSTNIKFSLNNTNENVIFAINFGDGIGDGDNLVGNVNANKFTLNFYEKNSTTNQYTIVPGKSSTYSFNQRDGSSQNNFLRIKTIVNRLEFVGGRYTLETEPVSFKTKEIKVELVPIYPFDIHFLSFEIVTSYNEVDEEYIDF